MSDPRFTLRDHAHVKELVYDKAARKVTAVRYVDARNGEEYEQPADLVALCAYVFNNTLLMLTAGIGTPYDPQSGTGTVGRNYCYQTVNRIQLFIEREEFNPFMASGVNGSSFDDVNGDNFDHAGLGFIGGAKMFCSPPSGRPILFRPVPPGTPRWGAQWKQATAKWYRHTFQINVSGASYAHRNNYLDLDPTYRDAIGRPLIRMTYDYSDNDRKLLSYTTAVAAKVAKAMNPDIMAEISPHKGHFNIGPYQSTHNTGGTIMGANPRESVVNRYLQSWDADNLFVRRRLGVSAECRLCADRHRRCARLLVRACDHDAVSQAPRRAGGCVAPAWSKPECGRRQSPWTAIPDLALRHLDYT